MTLFLLGWTALAAFEDRMFAEAARLAVEETLEVHRWVRALSFWHLGWNESLRTFLDPPRTRAETLLLVEARVALEPEKVIPLLRPYLQDSALGLWARDRLVQIFLKTDRPWDALVYYEQLPRKRRKVHLSSLVRLGEARQDTALLFALLSDMEALSPPAALFWEGALDSSRRQERWDRLLRMYPETPWADKAWVRYRPSLEAELAYLLAHRKFQEVLRKTENPRTPGEVEARFLAYYRQDRFRQALEVYRRYRGMFRELSPERTFQALRSAYNEAPPDYLSILEDLLHRGSPRYTDLAAHLTAHFLHRHPDRWEEIAPLVLRHQSGDFAFQLGIVRLTWGDTAEARSWFVRARQWAQNDFLAVQAAFWLRRIGEKVQEFPAWYSYYWWVESPQDTLDPGRVLDPPPVVEDRWLWAARLGETWWLPDSLSPQALKALLWEAFQWGHTPLALEWAYRYASATGQWMDVLPYLFPRPYRRVVCENAERYGVNPALVWAVMREESRFEPQAVSPAGAVGLMQVMPSTARRVTGGPVNLEDPEENIRTGVRYLAGLLQEFPHEMAALAAYNAGERHVRRWLAIPAEDPLLWAEWIGFRETRNYVRRVFRSYLIYSSLEKAHPACQTGL